MRSMHLCPNDWTTRMLTGFLELVEVTEEMRTRVVMSLGQQ